MTAPIPLFDAGELPFAEPPPRHCYWCWGPTTHGTIDHPDMRRCSSAIIRWCFNVSSDLATVVLDRVAELPRRWARVLVEISDGAGDRRTFQLNPSQVRGTIESGQRMPNGMFIIPGAYVSGRFIPDGPCSAICHAHPTPSQHLAECLLDDPDIASLLRDVRAERSEPLTPADPPPSSTHTDRERSP